DKDNTYVVRAHNLYFGGNIAPIMGTNDVIADPQFVAPSTDYTVADFHVKPGSPAIGTGRIEPFSPILDLDGKPRGATPDKGAYQK
ncbi:MAG: right-handed parallel beta-helix repeat-containing protein, partial [Armatimonadota bacterium]|nr:right-handed parallel beta-helix repeat-containing protein [Armatimonadota bacterium]